MPLCSPIFCLLPCGVTTGYFSDLICYTAVRRIHLACIYAHVQVDAAGAAAAAAALCVAILLLLLQLLVLAASVCDIVPDGKRCCWFTKSDSTVAVSPSSFNHDVYTRHPVAAPSHLRSGSSCSICQLVQA